ncbi:MAG TPA: right-handed parallel beta-helix repeat-containing protein [Acidobacteriaceae bacterium]|nr:right-handed parallel beta-helix repeat-containing protein [Acidobacteriaceae bacterium]
MRDTWRRRARLTVLLATLAVDSLFVGCGSTIGGSGAPRLAVTVRVSPASASVTIGAQQPFTATVENASNTAVTWQVNGITGGNATVGAISSSGLYTAPANVPNPATITVSAVSQADSTKSASATVTILAPVAVSISPLLPSVNVGAQLQFTATVENTSNTAVTWQINDETGGSAMAGTISSSGLYTAPATVPNPATATVTAISQADSSAAATTTLTVTVPGTANVCGSPVLDGPDTPPAGAVVVPAGDNSALTPNYANPGFSVPNTTFWFAPGIHTLGTGIYSQIQPGQGDVYIGAPGAIISGQNINQSAFVGTAANVTIEYLTVQDFASVEGQMVVNHDGGSKWTIAYDTIQNNTGGAGVGLGPNTVVTGDCLTNNGEYGFSSLCSGSGCDPLTGGPANITLSNNEISFNDSAGAYDQPGGISCGCSGGGKLWHVNGANITGNYVHDNGNVGIWADTDNTGVNISGNTISNNYAEGIIIEISYNFSITNNTLTDNAWSTGSSQAGQNIFPAIYISESGGDSRVPGNLSGVAEVEDNTFTDNWGGITLWENANRFCSDGWDDACTLVDPSVFTQASCAANLPSAVAGTDTGSPPADYYDGCRWKTQNVQVSGNVFTFNPANIPDCTVANLCGFNGLFSNYGTTVPYTSASVPTAITFHQGNAFQKNTYEGPWNFWAWNMGNTVTWAEWTAPVTDGCGESGEIQSGICTSGFGLDAGSTMR